MKLLILDGNSILNRAFFGIRLLTTKEGLYTNGVYGFLNILMKLREETSPDVVAAAFDLKAPTFRHKAYDQYKAGRKGMPPELAAQMPLLKDMLDAMGIARLEAEGFEADDILGTEAAACSARGDDCVVATGDRDSLQLVGPRVTVLLAGTKAGRPETVRFDEAAIRERYGVSPRELIEVKALMGDASDNIPGVPGVGEKTALRLIAQYGSVERIYRELPQLDLKPALREKLAAGRELAAMSRGLAEIRTDAPVETGLEKLAGAARDDAALYRLLAKLELFSLIERLRLSAPAGNAQKAGQAAAVPLIADTDADGLLAEIRKAGRADFSFRADEKGLSALCFAFDDKIRSMSRGGEGFEALARELLADPRLPKNTYCVKALFAAASRMGLSVTGELFDAMLAGYLLNPLASSYEPARLCGEYGASPAGLQDPEGLPEETAACARDAAAVRALAGILKEKIRQNGQEKLLNEVEIPLSRVLADMETVGFRVDENGIAEYGRVLEARIESLAKEIYGYAGYEFNINSTKQLGEVLFVKLGLPAKKKTKTGYSTNAEVLESLRGIHPVIDRLLEYRQLAKLKSTYADGLLKVIGPDGRIHSSFKQVETRTGRISSTEPNLQNIPVRSDVGRELRRYFIPDKRWVLVDADYSQIELRILAHIANDDAMLEAFNRHDDIHTITASQVFKMPPEMVTPLMRRRAKAVNFGIVYGISAFSLSQDIGVSVKEADRYIKNYLETFSGVRNYMRDVVAKAKEQGYVETLLGRRRALPELSSSNRILRSAGERIALNTPIQGTAADVIKIAMIRVHGRLKAEGLRARLILQVHDELIVEAPEEEAERVKVLVKEEMEGAMKLRVALEAEVHAGATWYDAK